MKNTLKKLPAGNATTRKMKKGKKIPLAKNKRSTARYFEVIIRLSAEDYARGLPYFENKKYLLKFIMDGYHEKINRAEGYNKAARLKKLSENVEMFEPIMREMFNCGKLNYLFKKEEEIQ